MTVLASAYCFSQDHLSVTLPCSRRLVTEMLSVGCSRHLNRLLL